MSCRLHFTVLPILSVLKSSCLLFRVARCALWEFSWLSHGGLNTQQLLTLSALTSHESARTASSCKEQLPRRCFFICLLIYWEHTCLVVHSLDQKATCWVSSFIPPFFAFQGLNTDYQFCAKCAVYRLSNLTGPKIFIKCMVTPSCVYKSGFIFSRDLPYSLTIEGSNFTCCVESGVGGWGAAAQVDFKQGLHFSSISICKSSMHISF